MTESEDNGSCLSPQAVIENTDLRDVTGDPGWLAAARWETTVAYSKLASAKVRLRIRDIYASICEDGYERSGRSCTIAAITSHPQTGTKELSGLVRVVFGAESRRRLSLAAIDAMNLVHPLGGWPHRRSGVGDGNIGELGRFTVIEKFRTSQMKAANVDAHLTRRLYDDAVKVAMAHNVKCLYAIMPRHAAEVVRRAGIDILEIHCDLRTDSEEAIRVFDEFPIYWKRLSPRLYQFADISCATASQIGSG
jgi:hypothetical protein